MSLPAFIDVTVEEQVSFYLFHPFIFANVSVMEGLNRFDWR